MATACYAQEILDFILVLPQKGELVFPPKAALGCSSLLLPGLLIVPPTPTPNHLLTCLTGGCGGAEMLYGSQGPLCGGAGGPSPEGVVRGQEGLC